MTDDDVRHLLSRYAATAPDLDPRAGLAERLGRRDRRRRAAVAVAACAAVVVAGTGVAALTRDRGGAGLVVADDLPTGEPTVPSPTASPASASPTASPAPAAEPSGSPAASSPAATSSPEPDFVPGGPVTATARGPEGLRIEATLSSDHTQTATGVSLRVVARDDDGDPAATSVVWGDGRSEPIVRPAAVCPAETRGPLATRAPQPGRSDNTFSHAWRHPGRYQVTVQVRSEVVCEDDPATEDAAVTLTIDIAPGRIVSNGPEQPAAVHLAVEPNMDTRDELYDYLAEFSIRDDDGDVRSVTIDWGDGSPPVVLRNSGECQDGDGRHYPTTYFGEARSHRYDFGEHTVTLTWESAGCDGKHVQRGRAQVEIFVESID